MMIIFIFLYFAASPILVSCIEKPENMKFLHGQDDKWGTSFQYGLLVDNLHCPRLSCMHIARFQENAFFRQCLVIDFFLLDAHAY